MLQYLFLTAYITGALSGPIFDSAGVPLKATADEWISEFDKNGDGFLNATEFDGIHLVLFRNEETKLQYSVPNQHKKDIFFEFDQNSDNLIDRDEFKFCYNNWIKTIFRPVSALLIVDVQNDFISGSLNISMFSAAQNGADVIKPINNLLDTVKFDQVYYSKDWHPNNHISFFDNLKLRPLMGKAKVKNVKEYDTVVFKGKNKSSTKQKLWPRHCEQNTWGSEFHKDLKIAENSTIIYKGTNPEVDSYSVFWDNNREAETSFHSNLTNANVTDLYVCGIAYDVCVQASAFDAQFTGYRTIVVDDCCRGVSLEDIAVTKKSVLENDGVIVDSSQVKAMVQGRDRRPELGYKLAMSI